jgi:hypothetical protein
VRLERSANDTSAVLSLASGGEALKKSCAFEWQKRFKEGRENVEDDERSGRPRSHRTDESMH